jgi:hypothetical protein
MEDHDITIDEVEAEVQRREATLELGDKPS